MTDKRILMVEVPKDFKGKLSVVSHFDNGREVIFGYEEFHPPTPVQINAKADEYATVVNSNTEKAFNDGVIWLKSLMI